MNRINAVFFDAHDTIIHLSPEAPDIYYLIGKEFGSNASLEDFRNAYYSIRDEWFSLPMRMEAIQSKDPVKRKTWWRKFVEAVYKTVGTDVISDEHFDRIYNSFTGSQYWNVFEDVVETLKSIKDMNIKLGVISNWDTRLFQILEDVGLYDYFDKIIISSEVGIEKPSPEIFEIAAKSLGVSLESSIFVGDSPEKDVLAANHAGMKGILIARDGFNFPDLDTIYNLKEIFDYINQ